LIVCLGATAAQSVFGKIVRISEERGKILRAESGIPACVTTHPSAIYRQRDKSKREQDYRHFLADIKLIRHYLA
jgi:DNA polymerase